MGYSAFLLLPRILWSPISEASALVPICALASRVWRALTVYCFTLLATFMDVFPCFQLDRTLLDGRNCPYRLANALYIMAGPQTWDGSSLTCVLSSLRSSGGPAEDCLLHSRFCEWSSCHSDKRVEFNGTIFNIIKVVLPSLSGSIFQVYLHSLVDSHSILSAVPMSADSLTSLSFH